MDNGLSFDASLEVSGEEGLALADGGGRTRRTGRYMYIFSFRRFWLLAASFHAFVFVYFVVWIFCFFHRVFDCWHSSYALQDGKRKNKIFISCLVRCEFSTYVYASLCFSILTYYQAALLISGRPLQNSWMSAGRSNGFL